MADIGWAESNSEDDEEETDGEYSFQNE